MRLSLLTAVIIFSLTACDIEVSKSLKAPAKFSERDRQDVNTKRLINRNGPVDEARKAIDADDCRYLAVANNEEFYLPGLGMEELEKAISENQYRILDDMKSISIDDQRSDAHQNTQEYMQRYNQSILKYCT